MRVDWRKKIKKITAVAMTFCMVVGCFAVVPERKASAAVSGATELMSKFMVAKGLTIIGDNISVGSASDMDALATFVNGDEQAIKDAVKEAERSVIEASLGNEYDGLSNPTGTREEYIAQHFEQAFEIYYNGIKSNPNFECNGVTVKATASFSMGATWNSIGKTGKPFKGTFNGNGETISGITKTDATSDIGLFGNVEGATFTNLTVSGSVATTNGDAGLVAAKGTATFENCSANTGISVSTDNGSAGILAGAVSGEFTNCTVTGGTVKAKKGAAGAIVGTNTLTTTALALKNCRVTSTTVSDDNSATGDTDAGLLAGKLTGSIEGSWGEGTITLEKGNAGMVAGTFTTGTFNFVHMSGGSNTNHEIEKVAVTVKSGNAGGIAGVLNGSCDELKTKNSCVVTVKDGNAGVIAGKATGTITNAVINGSANGMSAGTNYVGGMVGETTGTTVLTKTSSGQNKFTGEVSGDANTSTVGGAIGLNTGSVSISNFVNVAAPRSKGVLGGIVGNNRGALTLTDCDNEQKLGDNAANRPNVVGGLIGEVSGGTVTNASLAASHNTKDLHANEYVGDVIGEVSGGTVTLSNYETNAVNLYATTEGGMIGKVGGNGNVTLESCVRNGELALSTAVRMGGFIGQVAGGTVKVKKTENKKVIESTTDNSVVGGIIAEISGDAEVKVESCKNNVTLKAKKRAGGMIGLVNAGHATLDSCEVSGIIESDIVGGIVGQVNLAGADFVSCKYNDKKGQNNKLIGSVSVGGIVGDVTQGVSVTVDKCRFYGKIAKATTVGGIVGTISNGSTITVSACESMYPTNVEAKSSDYHLNGDVVGGIVGQCEKTSSTTTVVTVQGCTNERSIVGDRDTEITAGGIVGQIGHTSNLSNPYVTVSMCENLGQVEGVINGDDSELTAASGVYRVGGICGIAKAGAIEKCHNDGVATGGFGIVGTLDGTLASLSNSYNTGDAALGGVVGLVRKGKITNCYNCGKVTTKKEIINAEDLGFTESHCYYWNHDNTAYVAKSPRIFATGQEEDDFQRDDTPLDSKQFAKKASFVGWDFDKTWVMKKGLRHVSVRPVLQNLGDESKQPNADPESDDEKSEEEKAEEEKNKEKYKPTISMQDWVYDAPNQPGFVLTPGYADKGYKQIIVQYKKVSESAAAYTTDRPTEVGSYHVRVMLLDSPKYKDTDWIGPAVFQIKDQDKGNMIVGYPLPVSNQKTATISSAMGNGIVEMDELTSAFLNRIVGTSTSYDSIKIDASKATGAVRQLVMSRYSMEEIFKMMELRPYITNLKVAFYKGEVTLPYEKAKGIVAETAGQRLTVELWERTRESLYTEQMNAVLNMQVVTILNPRVTSNDEQVSVNGVKVTYPYTIPGSKVIDDYTVYGLDVDGSLREYPFTYAGGQFTFTAGYEGLYVIALREDNRTSLPTSTALNEDFTVRHLGNRLKIGWGKVSDATYYEVFVKKAGSKFDYSKPAATVRNGNTLMLRKLAGKSIGNKTSYKVRVIACRRLNGNRVRLGKSMIGYVVGTKNKKYTNTTLVTVRRTICFLSEGDNWYIGAKAVLVNKKKKLVPGYTKKFRYKSDDSSVASVTSKGKVIANNPGTCCIYVYAKNGLTRKVKITVE